MIWRASAVLFLALTWCVGTVAAQSPGGVTAEPPRIAVGFYVGAARNSPVGTHYGATPDRDHLFLGLHSTLNVWRTHRWSVGYAPEVVPLLIISKTPRTREVEF